MAKLQDIFVFLFVLFAGANGILIFGIFTFNKRIYRLYATLFVAKMPWIQRNIVHPIKNWRLRRRKISAQSQMSKVTISTQRSYIWFDLIWFIFFNIPKLSISKYVHIDKNIYVIWKYFVYVTSIFWGIDLLHCLHS